MHRSPAGSSCRELLRTHDWARTTAGPQEAWPTSLRGYVAMVMEMPTPSIIFWGPDQTQIYNDGYAVIMGPRHPRYFGATYEACWPETYPALHPRMQAVLDRGEVTSVERALVPLTRHGFLEEAYFTFTFSPLRDDRGAIAGIFQPVVEVTDAVLGERRAKTLRALVSRLDGAATVVADTVAALASNPQDVPFSLLYVRDDASGRLALVASTGLGAGVDTAAADRGAEVARRAIDGGDPVTIDDAERLLGGPHLGPWPEPTRAAIAVPVRRASDDPPLGAAILGVSPRLRFDDGYRAFASSVTRELAANLAAERAKHAEIELLAREQMARREAELQREHLVALIAQAPTPITLLRGPDHVIELVNPYTCQLWGRAEAEVLARPLFEALPELRGQVFETLLGRVYQTGLPHISHAPVVARLDRDGDGVLHDRHLTFVYSPLRTLGGEVDGILVIAFDVTEQILAREELDRLRVAAEAANDAKDEFLAILGHELRNPLSPILTAVELMRLRAGGALEREVEVIKRQADHLVRLVDDLLDVSRITRGKVELRRERIELADLLDRAIEMARPLLEQREHELVVELPRQGLAVEVDPTRLAQTFSNLLANAAKYTEKRGRITVTAAQAAAQLTVSIRDDGIGIEADMLPRVFEMFVQERQALDRTAGGLGLGLAIVRRLVELHGGRVEARSDGRGRGSEFLVTLPAAPAPAVADAPAASDAGRGGREVAPVGHRILVVDDNHDAAELLAEVLGALGHATRIAHDGPSAIRIAGEFEPQIGLLDIGLPVMDGYELARQLRAHRALAGVRLVAVTGYGQASDRQRALDAGFDAHLVKPVALEAIAALLRDLTPP